METLHENPTNFKEANIPNLGKRAVADAIDSLTEDQINKCGAKFLETKLEHHTIPSENPEKPKWRLPEAPPLNTETLNRAIDEMSADDIKACGADFLKTKVEYNFIEISEDPTENLKTAKELVKKFLMEAKPSEVEESILLLVEKFKLKPKINYIRILKNHHKEEKGKYKPITKNIKPETEKEDISEYSELYETVFNQILGRDVIKPIIQKIADYLKQKLNAFAYRSRIYVYHEGIYIEGQEIIKTELSALLREIDYIGREKDLAAEVLHCIEFSEHITEYPFNSYGNLIPVANGLIKINWIEGTKELIPFSPEYKFNYKLATAFNPDADTARIEELMSQYNGDSKPFYQIPAQALLQAAGHAPFKKAHLLQGHTNAGKSSYLELLYRTIGRELFSSVSLQELGNNRFKLASFEGCLFNIYDDLGEIPMNDCGKFKNLTGAYDFEIERKGIQGYKARLTNVQLYTCNSAPMLSDTIKKDAAFWERWEYVEFETRFETDTLFYDREYTQALREAFLLKIIEAAIQIHKQNKLLVIGDSGEVREKWFSNSDPIYQYLQDCTYETPENPLYLDRQEALDSFLRWCNDKDIPTTKRLSTIASFTSGAAWYDINVKKWDGFAANKTEGRYQGKVFVFPYSYRSTDEAQQYKVESIN